ncbi:MFS transporter [Nocardioides jejuensis]|nr:MFS transporter [Nocardioides jejuensis]
MSTVTASAARTVSERRRWAMLAVSTAAQAAASVAINGAAFLIPVLVHDRGLSLTQAGTVAALPLIGVLCTLLLWGAAVDRVGERAVLLAGLGGTALAGVAATLVDGTAALGATLFLAGAFAASTSSAGGRVVVGWFPPERRGLAMGIRQMAQPAGVGIAAVSIPVISAHEGVAAALAVSPIAALAAAAAVLVIVLDPPRPERAIEHTANPYRGSSYLQRIHVASILLVVPQFLVWTYALVWLLDDRGWAPAQAGLLVAATQLAGALGRIASGQLSDVVGGRMQPMRWIAIAAVVSMALLGLTAWLGWAVSILLLAAATTITVADNGLAFTATAERAGPYWSGRALGVQNTAQYLTAALCAPIAGASITHLGHPATFALSALFPLAAIPLVPVRGERPLA